MLSNKEPDLENCLSEVVMQVDDNLRERINSARRQNYSDDVIASVLAETMPKVQMALDERINPSIILDELASPPTMLEKTGRMAGIAARGATEALAPVAAGALAGGLIGGPPGAAVGAVAMPPRAVRWRHYCVRLESTTRHQFRDALSDHLSNDPRSSARDSDRTCD